MFLPRKGTFTPSSGTATVTLGFGDGVLMQIYVSAATSSTTFDVSLTDTGAIKVYDEQDITGTHNETGLIIPCYNNLTLTVENALVDELFTYQLIMKER